MERDTKIYIAGNMGLVGSSIVMKLNEEGYDNLCLIAHKNLDLRDSVAVKTFFDIEKPDYVFMAAATVGRGAANNEHPAKFFYDNIVMGVNVIDAAYKTGVKKLLYMGSSCIYPREAAQPM